MEQQLTTAIARDLLISLSRQIMEAFFGSSFLLWDSKEVKYYKEILEPIDDLVFGETYFEEIGYKSIEIVDGQTRDTILHYKVRFLGEFQGGVVQGRTLDLHFQRLTIGANRFCNAKVFRYLRRCRSRDIIQGIAIASMALPPSVQLVIAASLGQFTVDKLKAEHRMQAEGAATAAVLFEIFVTSGTFPSFDILYNIAVFLGRYVPSELVKANFPGKLLKKPYFPPNGYNIYY